MITGGASRADGPLQSCSGSHVLGVRLSFQRPTEIARTTGERLNEMPGTRPRARDEPVSEHRWPHDTEDGQRYDIHWRHVAKPAGGSPIGSLPSSSVEV